MTFIQWDGRGRLSDLIDPDGMYSSINNGTIAKLIRTNGMGYSDSDPRRRIIIRENTDQSVNRLVNVGDWVIFTTDAEGKVHFFRDLSYLEECPSYLL